MDNDSIKLIEPLKENLIKLPIIKSFDEKGFLINNQFYNYHISIDHNLIKPLHLQNEHLDINVFKFIESLRKKPDILLLGVGKTYEKPELKMKSDLSGKGIQLEIMSTESACRTWNILISESRNIVAFMLFPEMGV